MQPGATFVAGLFWKEGDVSIEDGELSLGVRPIYSRVSVRATALWDFCVLGDAACCVFSTGDATFVIRACRGTVEYVREVNAWVRRVVETPKGTFIASSAQVTAVGSSADPIAMDPIDIASNGSEIAVLDTKGLTIFDERGERPWRIALTAPTVVASDRDGGWIVADDGDLVAISRDSRTVLARDVGLVTRVRRGDALYFSSMDGGLHEIVDGVRSQIAKYAPRFTNFDARSALFVDEGSGPVRFYAETECNCRTRTVRRGSIEHTVEPDGYYRSHQELTCPRCGKTWIDSY